MIKAEVIEYFTLEAFNELKNIERASNENKNENGKLYPGDTFNCNEEMAKYLSGSNKYKKPFIKVLEVLPKKVEGFTLTEKGIKEIEKRIKENASKKATSKKKTSKK